MIPVIESLELRDISFGYDGGDEVFSALSFIFPVGEIVNLQGPHGSGKSTLFKILMGLSEPTLGSFLVNGKLTADMTFEEYNPYRLAMGYTFDSGGLIHNRTILENLTLPLVYHKICNEREASERAHGLLSYFDIHTSASARPSAVPGRVRKAAVIARAFIMNPSVLLLDDPSTGLSSRAVQNLKSLIGKKRASGELKYVFSISDDFSFCEGLVTRDIQVTRTALLPHSLGLAS